MVIYTTKALHYHIVVENVVTGTLFVKKMWFCRKIRVFFGQNHILFTKMNFEILQPLFCEIYSIVVMIMTQTTFKCEKNVVTRPPKLEHPVGCFNYWFNGGEYFI